MSERNLKDLFCVFCKEQIEDRHINESLIGESFDIPWKLYWLYCTKCGHGSYVSRAEAEK